MKLPVLFRLLLVLATICFLPLKLNALDHHVQIAADGFYPDYLEIAQGDRVIWFNNDTKRHTVTSFDGVWPSASVPSMSSYNRTFNTLGQFIYYSEASIYPGIIVVKNNPPPVNDLCNRAMSLTTNSPVMINTTRATSSGDPTSVCDQSAGKGVWFSFIPPTSGTLTLSTCGSSFNTVMAIYATCGSTAVAENCNDNYGPGCDTLQASVSFFARANTSYSIYVGGVSGQSGTLKISANLVLGAGAAVTNDTCAQAINLSPGILYQVNTTNATSQGDKAPLCGTPFGKAVWYSYTPTNNTTVTISTCGSDYDTLVDAYYGDCSSLIDLIGNCKDNNGPACGGLADSRTLSVIAGRTYRFMIGGVNGASGNLRVLLYDHALLAPPINDKCTNATVMTTNITYSVDTTYATSTSDPSACETLTQKGVWYTFTPARRGVLTLSTCESDFDTTISMYTGDCGTLVLLPGSCNNDNGPLCNGPQASTQLPVIAGKKYWILVGSPDGQSGILRLKATLGPPANWQEETLGFSINSSIAQTASNVVHMVDSTNRRLLSLDTGTGSFVSNIRLQAPTSGFLAISLDQERLFVSLPGLQKVQVISLKTLATEDLLPLSLQPQSLSMGADGMMYLAANDRIHKMVPTTGLILGEIPRNFQIPIIKSNPDGTKLYVMEASIQPNAPVNIGVLDEYTVVASALPVFVTNHIPDIHTGRDFLIAEEMDRLYAAVSGTNGMQAWNITNRVANTWTTDSPFGSVAVASLPGSPHIYVASAEPTLPLIRSFDKLTGATVRTYSFSEEGLPSDQLDERSLHVTPNERIFYTRRGRRIGLIGAPSLNISLPPIKEWIDAGTNITVTPTDPFTLQAVAPSPASGEIFSWSKLDGPGVVQFSTPTNLSTTVSIDTPGLYTLQVSRNNGSTISRDRVSVTVVPKPIRIIETSVDETGRFNLLFDAPPDNHVIEASTNLVDWDIIGHAFNAEGRYTVQDPVTNRTQRFYRIRRAVD